MSSGAIEERAAFDRVRYANCWEDADILCRALEPGPGKRMLSIASGGDNAFALAAAGAEVVAVDLSPAQLALCRLKQAAITALEHGDLLGFLGLAPAADRPRTYARLRSGLDSATRDFWDAHPRDLEQGVSHMGKFERYFRLFRTRVLPLVHSRRRVTELVAEKGREERERFFNEQWDNRRWRLMFRFFFSRRVMGRLGRDPEFFRYVEGSVAERILERARSALTALPTHDNPYLRFILFGSYGPALPRYLRPENHSALRQAMGRVSLVHGQAQAAARADAQGFHGFNLSDIFEYLDPAACEEAYQGLLSAALPGARLAFWNMLAPRARPQGLAHRVRPLAELSARLFAQDKAFFYSAFHVEEAT